MTFDIDMIKKVYAGFPERIEAARQLVGRPLTLAEKILNSHLWDGKPTQVYQRGIDYVDFAPDRVAMQDATAQMALLQFMQAGKKKVYVPSTVHCDHLIQAKVEASSDTEEAYVPQTDNWRRDKLGETYAFNTSLPFASVPDRGLFLLQQHGVKYTFNEMIAIQTHDGLYDAANEKYLKSFMPETKPRTSLLFILHQADMMAARIEFEIEWLPKLSKNSVAAPKKNYTLTTKSNAKSKALNTLSSPGLKSMLENL